MLWALYDSFVRAGGAKFDQDDARWVVALLPTRRPPWGLIRVPFDRAQEAKMLDQLGEGEWRVVRALDRGPLPRSALVAASETDHDDLDGVLVGLEMRGVVQTSTRGFVGLTADCAEALRWLPD